jgi:hypothetical protein
MNHLELLVKAVLDWWHEAQDNDSVESDEDKIFTDTPIIVDQAKAAIDETTLARSIMNWWKDARFLVYVDDDEEEYNVFYDEPDFVILAKDILDKQLPEKAIGE